MTTAPAPTGAASADTPASAAAPTALAAPPAPSAIPAEAPTPTAAEAPAAAPSGGLGVVPDNAVAVIGMGGRFPGARDLDAYWANLLAGTCSLTDFTPDELLADGADPDQVRNPSYVPAKGHLEGADRFDAELFGFTPAEAAVLDPQHRLLLETAWTALQDAGYDPQRAPARTGVYVGGSLTEHMLAAHGDPQLAGRIGAMQVRILTDREFLAPWTSYRLGLDGPSMTVQTACSTSLTAVHLACQALLLGECDTALAGGAAVDSVRRRGYLYQDGGILSPDGRCRPFDARAAGTVPGNGVGVVVLRRLADALADGDPVRAVIRGSAVTNDGRARLGFTAPGVERQTAAIIEAWDAADLDPRTAQYLEAHGTATALGDRVELAAAAEAFRGGRIGLGSVKSNLGHLDAAAGVAALIKTVLMLEHAVLVPVAGATAAHPGLDLDATPFRVVDRPAPWPAAPGPRRAAVTSLGIGGTNAHVVLEQAPERPAPAAGRGETAFLPLSARTEPALAALAARLAAALRAPGGPTLEQAAHTLRTGRPALTARAHVLAADTAGAADVLDQLALRPPGALAGTGLSAPGADVAGPAAALAAAWHTAPADQPPAPGPGYPLGPGAAAAAQAGAPLRVSLPAADLDRRSFGALSPAVPVAPVAGAVAPPQEPGEEAALQAAVCALLADALGLPDPSDAVVTYFSAGGDSLTAVHLVGRLREELGLEVPITLFLEDLTLPALARLVIDTARPDTGEDSLDALLSELEAQ
ncbi:hypothetical protein GXW83_17985 [Streptacidiphilus sp. PB12-B1b]|uniref:type I polyketide synthase n=1 Tax=Streptacidiphilus sp. PB12-B1b TaxID=2705012 RepID=UPI0015FDA2E4|nr:type I polyketide synthase [Streptacidiphilus sp. PB12-B1b]QMU77305.1 hypothetical protein GXW83_17985 [Streptacidiphilus sp. PB12-B1b]